MWPIVLSSSSGLPITLATMKKFLRETSTAMDEEIEALMYGAAAEMELYLQRTIMRKSLRLSLDSFFMRLKLTQGPVISVSSVSYRTDGSPEYVAVDPAVYAFDQATSTLYLQHGQSWPASPDVQLDAVRVDYQAGYVDDSVSPVSGTLPKNLEVAFRVLVQARYDRDIQSMAALIRSAYTLMDSDREGQGV